MRPGFKKFINKFGANPKKSWRHFLMGLGIFLLGLFFTLYDHQLAWLSSAGLFPLFCGFILAMYGYLGIFASRFNRLL